MLIFLRNKIDAFLIDYTMKVNDQSLLEYLKSETWTSISNLEYSFKIFERIKLQGNLAQNILEKKSAYDRLQSLTEILNLNKGLS